MNKAYKDILTLGIPAFLESLFNTFATIIDSKMVSVMGLSAISAVSVTNQPRLFVFAVFFAIGTVTSSLVARYYGMKDRDGANRIFDHVIKIVIALSIILSILCVVLAKPIMLLFSGQRDTMQDSILYFRIVMGGMIFTSLFSTINAALRGYGKTKLTFLSNTLSCLVNLGCNYLLIEGHLGFPALGMAGAAIATVMGTVAAFVLCLVFICREGQFINIRYCLKRRYSLIKDTLREIMTLTKNTVVDRLALRLGLLVISGIIARLGSFQLSIYSVGMYLLNFNFSLGMGLETAAVALVGRSYGEGSSERIQMYKKALIRMGFICSIALGVLIAGTGRLFYSFFSHDATFVRIGGICCVVIGLVAVAQTEKFALNGCMLGVSAMREVMIASVVGTVVVNLGLTALVVLVLHLGVPYVFLCALTAQTAQALILYYFMKKHPAFAAGGNDE